MKNKAWVDDLKLKLAEFAMYIGDEKGPDNHQYHIDKFIAFISSIEDTARSQTRKECAENLKYELYKLDWISILNEAIKSRPTSWYDTPVREWRNASDEICGAVIRALEEKKLLPSFRLS